MSEDPTLIHAAGQWLGTRGVRVIGCLGPTHTRCNLDDRNSCPLAEHAAVALIDSPAGGAFTHHWKTVQGGTYAEHLQRAHPDCKVILCGAPEGVAGPTGEVALSTNSWSVLALLHALFADRQLRSAPAA